MCELCGKRKATVFFQSAKHSHCVNGIKLGYKKKRAKNDIKNFNQDLRNLGGDISALNTNTVFCVLVVLSVGW